MNKKSTFRSVANNYLTRPNDSSGITLIALVVTIIVLLILARYYDSDGFGRKWLN